MIDFEAQMGAQRRSPLLLLLCEHRCLSSFPPACVKIK